MSSAGEAEVALVLQKLEVEVNPLSPQYGATLVLEKLRPQWKPEETTYQLLSGGTLNKLLLCHLTADTDTEDAIVLRIFTDGLGINRDQEIFAMTIAGHLGVAPPVHAIFSNGVAYKFIPGEIIDCRQRDDINFIRPISRLLKKLHMVDVRNVHILDTIGKVYTICNKHRSFVHSLRDYVEKVPDKLDNPERDERYQKQVPRKHVLLAEIDRLIKWVESTEIPIVFCHNDAYHKNIVREHNTGDLKLMDYEFAGLNYETYDTAVFHMTTKFFVAQGQCDPDIPDSNDVTFRKWAQCMLEASHEVKGQSEVNTEEMVSQYSLTMKIFQAIQHFREAVFFASVLNNDSLSGDNDNLSVCVAAFEKYFDGKKLITGL